MGHWLDEMNDRRVGQALQPISYSPGANKYHSTITTQANQLPITTQQGIDKNAAAAFMSKTADPAQMKGAAGAVWRALVGAGFPGVIMNWVFALCYMESGGFSNTLFKKDNNPGSIMMYAGARQGTYVPGNGTYAANFLTLDDFAAKFYNLMNSGARPIAATSLEDFVHRLKLNNYFGKESEASYYNKLAGTMNRLRLLDATYKAADAKMNKDAHPKSKVPVWEWVALGLGGLLVLKGLSS